MVQLFCYEASNKISVMFPGSSLVFFSFLDEPFFATLKKKGHVSARGPRGWEIKSLGCLVLSILKKSVGSIKGNYESVVFLECD
jgi:hypothetical protein